jgi:ribosomal protein S18 acetylase RimI-like enzyme
MHVREMQAEDADVIHAIHIACLTISLKNDYTQEQLDAWMSGRTPDGYRQAATEGERFFVAVRDLQVVGYASWQEDELLSLFVLPDHQDRGIGSALFEKCTTDAARHGATISKIRATPNAVAFYRHHGFVTLGRGFDVKKGVAVGHVKMTSAVSKVGFPLSRE